MWSRVALRFALLGLLTVTPLAPAWTVTARTTRLQTSDCVELVQNGGFEYGDVGWQAQSAQQYELISDFNPRTGKLGAYLAGVNNADDSLSQLLVLPAGRVLTLTAWWSLATAETAGAFDTLSIVVLQADGMELATLAKLDNTAPAGQWELLSFDLSEYAGQNVVIRFAAHTDQSNVSDFYLDDISVSGCGPGDTTTPTPPPATPTAAPGTTIPGAIPLYLPLIQR
jgi:hypothetical protein